MNVFTSIPELSRLAGPAYLAVGVFDGVHRGHRAVLERALGDARHDPASGQAVAVTFDPHPTRVLRPDRAPRLLTSTAHKLRELERMGMPHALVIPFDDAFARTPPAEFIAGLARAARPLREICVGYDWSFGKNRAGNLDLLARLGGEWGFACVGLPPVKASDGRQVSSTVIRAAVEAGRLDEAALLLGREFTILGTVRKGRQLGRTLGFPTANLAAHNEQFPPNGVYAADAWLDGDVSAAPRRGILNLGVRPTVENAAGERLLELHLFDFDENLYGREVEVAFRRFLRPERKFESLDALKAQITRDCAEARERQQ